MVEALNVGDRVRWIKVSPDYHQNAEGIVVAVIPSDTNLPQFNMYDVQFPFGTFTLYGTQIQPSLKSNRREKID